MGLTNKDPSSFFVFIPPGFIVEVETEFRVVTGFGTRWKMFLSDNVTNYPTS